MRNKLTKLAHAGLAAIAVGSICLIGSVAAQNTSQYKPLSDSDYGSKPKASPKAAATSGGLSDKDKTFMMNATKGGKMEVEWGKVAAQKAQNSDVKAFGNRMVTDHSKANDELMSIASKKGVKLPATNPKMKWTSDKAYMDMMEKDHEKDLAEFQAEASGGSDPDLKKFAEKTSKVVEKHLTMAKEIDGKLK
jgi:putative membrane protein